MGRFAHTILTTKREAALLKNLDEFTRRARLQTITNGIDLERYRPDAVLAPADVPENERRFLNDLSTPRLVFTGAMDYYANVDGMRYFADEVFPLIRQREPRAQFFIVGSNPTAEVKRLGEREGITRHGLCRRCPPVSGLGYSMHHAAAHCARRAKQNPRSDGCRSRRNCHARSRRRIASRGWRTSGSSDVNARELADAALKVMEDEGLRMHLGAQARRFVEEDHDWTPLLARLTDLVESVGARGIAAEAQWRDHAKARR